MTPESESQILITNEINFIRFTINNNFWLTIRIFINITRLIALRIIIATNKAATTS